MSYQETFSKRITYSQITVQKLRQLLENKLPENISVVITGSFARQEASDQSDVDYFLLVDATEEEAKEMRKQIKKAHADISKAIVNCELKAPSAIGAFGQKFELKTKFLTNVGGNDDPNIKLTQRLLLLLEGDWIFGEDIFIKTRDQLVKEVYIRSSISDHQLARFLLNDLIRYWRTIGVDFEFKTVEAKKGWGIRNIKLLYSRKLMYFSGLIMVAETAQSTRKAKVDRVLYLASKTPIQRLQEIFGSNCDEILAMYSDFVNVIADEKKRISLDEVTIKRESHTEEFKKIKHAGHKFSLKLEQLLKNTYAPSHPIHHAMLF